MGTTVATLPQMPGSPGILRTSRGGGSAHAHRSHGGGGGGDNGVGGSYLSPGRAQSARTERSSPQRRARSARAQSARSARLPPSRGMSAGAGGRSSTRAMSARTTREYNRWSYNNTGPGGFVEELLHVDGDYTNSDNNYGRTPLKETHQLRANYERSSPGGRGERSSTDALQARGASAPTSQAYSTSVYASSGVAKQQRRPYSAMQYDSIGLTVSGYGGGGGGGGADDFDNSQSPSAHINGDINSSYVGGGGRGMSGRAARSNVYRYRALNRKPMRTTRSAPSRRHHAMHALSSGSSVGGDYNNTGADAGAGNAVAGAGGPNPYGVSIRIPNLAVDTVGTNFTYANGGAGHGLQAGAGAGTGGRDPQSDMLDALSSLAM